MDLDEHAADLCVVDSGEESRALMGIFFDPRADGLDDENIGESGEHRFTAGLQPLRFRREESKGRFRHLHKSLDRDLCRLSSQITVIER